MPERPPYKKRDAVLDFWRGVSILLVIENHLVSFRFHAFLASFLVVFPRTATDLFFTVSEHAGMIGVRIFLVISGYIITKVLMEEETLRGKISLRLFYLRRFFRIMPAYLLYLACLAGFLFLGWITADRSQIACALFLANTNSTPCLWGMRHLWSLSIEEQFYAVWPLFLLLIPKMRRIGCMAFLYIFFAALSVFGIFTVNGWIDNGWAFACIAGGALYAANPFLKNAVRTAGALGVIVSAALIGMETLGFSETAYIPVRFAFRLLTPFAIMGIIEMTRRIKKRVESAFFKAVARLGLMSYSFYIWQNIFTDMPNKYIVHSPLEWPILMVPLALLSYFFVEKPITAWSRARFRQK